MNAFEIRTCIRRMFGLQGVSHYISKKNYLVAVKDLMK